MLNQERERRDLIGSIHFEFLKKSEKYNIFEKKKKILFQKKRVNRLTFFFFYYHPLLDTLSTIQET